MDVNLVMFTPKGKRKDFPLSKSTTVIGRGQKCDLRVPVLSVSRRHCELTFGDDALNIRDLGSSNGTYVDNERISEGELEAGDRLVVGPVVFTVQIDGKPEEIEPTPAAQAGGEVVDLETAEQAGSEQTGITESDIVSALQPEDEEDEEEDSDAISALEALASEAEEKESEEQDEKQE